MISIASGKKKKKKKKEAERIRSRDGCANQRLRPCPTDWANLAGWKRSISSLIYLSAAKGIINVFSAS